MAQPEAPALQGDTAGGKQVIREESYLQGLSDEFRGLAEVELVVEENCRLPCHSSILRLHSKVFDEVLRKDVFSESAGGKKEAGCHS